MCVCVWFYIFPFLFFLEKSIKLLLYLFDINPSPLCTYIHNYIHSSFPVPIQLQVVPTYLGKYSGKYTNPL